MIKPQKDFKQVCVWEGTIVTEEEIPEFEKFIKEEVGVRCEYLFTLVTPPDKDSNGNDIKDTGGRHDIFFGIHKDDIGKATIPRLRMGIRWLEDVLADGNYRSKIYPDEIFELVTWNQENISYFNK